MKLTKFNLLLAFHVSSSDFRRASTISYRGRSLPTLLSQIIKLFLRKRQHFVVIYNGKVVFHSDDFRRRRYGHFPSVPVVVIIIRQIGESIILQNHEPGERAFVPLFCALPIVTLD